MKALTLIITLSSLALSSQSQAFYSVASQDHQIDMSEVKLYVGALEGAARDWLKTCQSLEDGELANQLASDIRSCVRLARNFQLWTMDFGLVSEDQTALKIAVDEASLSYQQVSSNYRIVRRKILTLSRTQDLNPLLTRQSVKELDESYRRLRTLYVALSNLLTTGEVY